MVGSDAPRSARLRLLTGGWLPGNADTHLGGDIVDGVHLGGDIVDGVHLGGDVTQLQQGLEVFGLRRVALALLRSLLDFLSTVS